MVFNQPPLDNPLKSFSASAAAGMARPGGSNSPDAPARGGGQGCRPLVGGVTRHGVAGDFSARVGAPGVPLEVRRHSPVKMARAGVSTHRPGPSPLPPGAEAAL